MDVGDPQRIHEIEPEEAPREPGRIDVEPLRQPEAEPDREEELVPA